MIKNKMIVIIRKKMTLLVPLLFLFMTLYANAKPILAVAQYQQLVVVITDNWQVDHGLMYTFVKVNGVWQTVSAASSVTVGKHGLAWGLGLHNKQQGQYKIEGDGKAPAGIFSLGDAFGYFKTVNTHMRYQQMSVDDYCIDVNGSRFYNQIVDKSIVGEAAIKGSTEPMRRDLHLNGDIRYKKGLLVGYNPDNIVNAGSCIFLHVWQRRGAPTAGCTAMSEATIDGLLAWLDINKKPLYVALPKAEYLKKQQQWQLPDISF